MPGCSQPRATTCAAPTAMATPTGTASATTRNGSASANRSTCARLWPRSFASATCVRRVCAAVETSAKSSSRVSRTSGVRAATITRDSSVCSERTWSKTESRSRSGSTSDSPLAASIAAALNRWAVVATRSIDARSTAEVSTGRSRPTRKVCDVIDAGATSRAGAVGSEPVPRCGGTRRSSSPLNRERSNQAGEPGSATV